jgi:hypothetical protein
MRVSGEILVEPTPKEVLARAAANDEDKANQRKKFRLDLTTLIVVTIYAGLTAIQSCQSIRSANAAISAADTAKTALEIQTRPWVGVVGEPTIENGIIFVVLKNYGNTPAIVVPPRFIVHRLGKPEFRYWKIDIPKADLCDFEPIPQDTIDETKPRDVFAIFPSDTKKVRVGVFTPDDPFNSNLSGCIVYNVSDIGYYMTRVIYDLFYVDEHRNKLASPKIGPYYQADTLEWKRGTPKPD